MKFRRTATATVLSMLAILLFAHHDAQADSLVGTWKEKLGSVIEFVDEGSVIRGYYKVPTKTCGFEKGDLWGEFIKTGQNVYKGKIKIRFIQYQPKRSVHEYWLEEVTLKVKGDSASTVSRGFKFKGGLQRIDATMRVQLEWNPDKPMLVNISVKEKLDGLWKVPERSLYVRLKIRSAKSPAGRFKERSLIGAYYRSEIAAYGQASGLIVFSASLKEPLYKVGPGTGGKVSANLAGGRHFGRKSFLGQKQWHVERTHKLDPRLLTDAFTKLFKGLKPGFSGRLVAEIDADVYKLNENGDVEVLATSVAKKVWIDRIAEILRTNHREGPSPLVEVFRPNVGIVKNFWPSEMGIDLKKNNCVVPLIPNDRIKMGLHDGVKIRWPLTQEEWLVNTNTSAFRGLHALPVYLGMKDPFAEVYIFPASGPDSIAGKLKWGCSFLVGIGVNVLAVKASGGWLIWTARAIGAAAAGVTKWVLDHWVYPEKTIWGSVELEGTIYGLTMNPSELGIYLFEGKANVSNIQGTKKTLSPGQMSKVSETGMSQPTTFAMDELPATLKSAFVDAAKAKGISPDFPEKRHASHDIAFLKANVTKLKFYEEGTDDIPLKQRIYKKRFSRDKSRYICWELNLDFAPPGRRIDFEIVAEYYNPDGSLFNRHSKASYIQKHWKSSKHTAGTGWDELGNWDPGKYRVDIFVKGNKVASEYFEITNAISLILKQYDLPFLKANVTGLKFYEEGIDDTPLEQRIYKKRFSRKKSRYICWELNLDFVAPGRRIDFEIIAEYYRPDGSQFSRDSKPSIIEKDWEDSVHTAGSGWDEPGEWKPGKYRVDILVKGKKVASEFFELY